MTILGILCAGAALGLGALATLIALAEETPVDVGPRETVIPRVDIRC